MAKGTKPADSSQVRRLREALAREKAKSAALAKERAEAREQQAATAEILNVISTSPSDAQPVFDAIVRRALRLLGGHSAAVTRIADGMLHLEALTSTSKSGDATLKKNFPRALSRAPYYQRVIRSRAPYLIRDTEKVSHPLARARELGRARGYRSSAMVPMLRDGVAIGTVSVTRKEPGAFSKRQIELLQTFAAHAVIAIENVRRFNETNEALERQTATAEILKVIASSPSDVQPVFDAIGVSAIRLLGGHSFSVSRIEGDMLHLSSFSTVNKAGDEMLKASFPFRISRNPVVADAVRTKTALYVADTERDPRVGGLLRDVARARGYRSMLHAPMLREERVVGLIHVTRAEAGAFTDHHLQLIKTFADQAVIAIENVRLFNETKEALERQTATAEILRVIAGSPSDVQPVFDGIVRSAMRLIGGHSAAVTRVVGDSLHLAAYTSTSKAGDRALQSSYPRALSQSVFYDHVFRTRAPHFVADTEQLSGEQAQGKEIGRARGYRSALFVPLLRDGAVVGTIGVTRGTTGAFTAHQIGLLQAFADQAVIAIENVRLFNETKEALERQTATAEILKVISSSPTDVQPVFDTIADHAARLCDATTSAVYRSDGKLVDVAAVYNTTVEASELLRSAFPCTLDREVAGVRAIRTSGVVEVQDVRNHPGYYIPKAAEMAGFRKVLAVPMLREGTAIGSIAVTHPDAGRFSAHHVELLETFADQAVIAIENVRLFKELEARNRDLAETLEQQTAISEVLRVISASPAEVQPMLEAVASRAARICEASDARIFLVEGDRLRHAAGFGDVPVVVESFPLNRTSASGRAVLDCSPVHIPDIITAPDEDYAFSREIASRAGWRTALVVPLMREDRALGTITLRRRNVLPFTEKQISLLQTFADQAAIAIENVRLFNETKEALERQTATAAILKVIASSPSDVQPVFEAIARNALALCGSAVANVFRYDGKLLHHAASHQVDPEQIERVRRGFPRSPDRSRAVGRAILSKSVVCIEDALTDPEYDRALAKPAGWRRMFAVPMLREGEPIGSIAVTWIEPGPIAQDQVRLLQTFADQAVIAIENVRLFNETKEALERQTATAEILNVISSSPTEVQPVYDAIVKSALRLIGGTSAAVTRVVGDLLHLVALTSTSDSGDETLKRSFPWPVTRGLTGKVLRTGVPAVRVDSETDPDTTDEYRELARARGFRSNLIVPLMREGVAIGAISVTRSAPGPFSEHHIGLLKTFADQAVIAIENVRLFNETKEALERQTATAEILASMSGSMTDTKPVFDAIVRNLLRLFGTLYAAVFLVRDGRLEVVGLKGEPGFEKVAEVFPTALDDGTFVGQAILAGEVIQLTPIIGNPAAPTERFAREFGFNSALTAPMIREGKVIGAISTSHRDAVPFDDKQVALIKSFADQAVIAIENVRLFNETKEALDRQTATSEILKVISSSPTDTQPVFDTIVRNFVALSGGAFGAVFRYEGGLVHYAGSAGFTSAQRESVRTKYPVRVDDPSVISSRTVLTRAPVHVHDVRQDPQYDLGHAATADWRRMLAVPMLRDGEPLGAIVAAWTEAGATPKHHEDLLKTFADQAVIAIENVRLFKELQARTEQLTKSVRKLTALGEVGQAISSTLDLETVLKTIVSRALQLTGLDSGSIYEYDEHAEEFQLRAAENVDDEYLAILRHTPIHKGEGAVGRAALTGEPTQIPDVLSRTYKTRLREAIIRAGYRSVLVVPLRREDYVIGALSVARKTSGSFAPEIVELLKTFATQSALAIQNARLFREIAEKGKQLEVASQHKSQFLASMSHELRTPLNALLGFNEMILGEVYGPVSEDMQPPLAQMQTSGKHLLRLINNVLDLAKIEAGRMELALSDYSVHDTVEAVRSTLRPLAAEKGIELLATVPGDIPLAYGDSGRITQCLMNLAGNSLKFTKVGKVEISVAESGKKLTYRVADTGIGIPPDKMESLFTEFKQTDATIASEYGGTGLGLSISKKFVEMHGGRIWVESIPGQGSTFSFEIPLRAGEGKEA